MFTVVAMLQRSPFATWLVSVLALGFIATVIIFRFVQRVPRLLDPGDTPVCGYAPRLDNGSCCNGCADAFRRRVGVPPLTQTCWRRSVRRSG